MKALPRIDEPLWLPNRRYIGRPAASAKRLLSLDWPGEMPDL